MRRVVVTLLCLALAGPVAVAAPAAAQTGEPLCRNGFFLVQGRNLLRFDERAARHLPVRRLPSQVNALAYLPGQERFYAVAGSRVVTVTPGGRITDAGPAPHGLRGALAGAANGTQWIVRSHHHIVTLRVPSLAVVSRVHLSRSMDVGDWDLNPRDGMLYGLTSGLEQRLLRADPRTGKVTTVATPRGLPLLSSFGAVAIDPHGTLHALHNATGRLYHIILAAPSQTRSSKLGLHAAESDAARCPEAWDYGDFPGQAARHRITTLGALSLGGSVGADDGIARTTAIASAATTFDLPVSVRNTTGSPALLAAWHDLDGNGAFTLAERALAPVTPGATTVTLHWPRITVPARLTTTRLRLRLYGEAPAEPAPTGSASGGEVEDHQVPVRRPAAAQPVPPPPPTRQPATPQPSPPSPPPSAAPPPPAGQATPRRRPGPPAPPAHADPLRRPARPRDHRCGPRRRPEGKYPMNTLTAAILVVAVAAALSAGGFLLASRFIPDRWLVADSDGAGTVYATIAMVYAILIAIAAIAVWEPRSAAAAGTEQEAAALVEAHWSANALAPTDRTEIQNLILGYLNEANGNEWRNLRDHHRGTAAADDLFTRLRQRIDSAQTTTDRQLAAQQQAAGHASTAATARMSRLSSAAMGIPPLLWWTLVLGGLISIVFLYMFGLRRTFPNSVMLATVGGMLALMLFILYQVEYPFSRGFAITPASLDAAITHLSTLT